MVVTLSPHPLSTKSMALVLLLVLTALFPNDVMVAWGGAMGGGFASSADVSGDDSSNSHSSTTFEHRDIHMYQRQNGMEAKDTDTFSNSLSGFVLFFGLVFMAMAFFNAYKSKTSVVKLQVALKGTSCSLQQDLNSIALKADTSTQEGYKYVLEGTTMKTANFCELHDLYEETRRDKYQAERLFNDLSFEERSKVDEETLVNLDNHREQKSNWEMVSTSASPFIVVNLLVATVRELKLSPIYTASDLEATLKKLGGLAKIEILAVHVLWTPQRDNDHLSAERLHRDYPLLIDLRSKSD